MEMNNYIWLLFLFGAAVYVCQSSAFLLSSECPAPSPCTCTGSSGSYIYIYCNSKSLTAIPQIAPYNATVNSLTVYFSSNSLTTIPNNAFRNLSSVNVSTIYLYMYSNNINVIGNDAFKGVENITTLHLYNNNLTTIPFAISKLTHLQVLYIQGNPLRSIDSSVMSRIGGSLKTLQLDLGGFTEWPADLHYLRNLQTLQADYIPFPHLDMNAFHGFENTLTSLTMNYAKLEKVPHAICQLTRLTSLTFTYDNYLKENKSSIFEPCGHTLPTVTTLDISSNSLHTFPDVFSLFPSLTTLSATNNKFEYIDGSKIPSNSRLTSIYLQNNLFERIPSALNKLKSLNTVYLHYNKIKTIESADLYGLPLLRNLILDNNPIAYIAPGAFSHNPEMYQLQMQNTELDHVPQAITPLSKLYYLYLEGNNIDCTCDMSYLKRWNASSIYYFNTKCAGSDETIQTFVMTSLQSCP